MNDMKIAGAPISWGVCEAPGWGYQMEPNRVLAEMRKAGLIATELGPDGFLPTDPHQSSALLDQYGLGCVGKFAPLVLHDPTGDAVSDAMPALDAVAATGGHTLVLAAVTGSDGCDCRSQLNDDQWGTLLANLDRVVVAAAERGVAAVLHPHVGTMVETSADVDRVLAGSGISLCLDTGHLFVGGTNPVELARTVPHRVGLVHLKDVDAALLERVRAGELSFTQAIVAGIYPPLGAGDIDIIGAITALRDNGFDGWFVLEPEIILDGEPADDKPLRGVVASLKYLDGALGSTASPP